MCRPHRRPSSCRLASLCRDASSSSSRKGWSWIQAQVSPALREVLAAHCSLLAPAATASLLDESDDRPAAVDPDSAEHQERRWRHRELRCSGVLMSRIADAFMMIPAVAAQPQVPLAALQVSQVTRTAAPISDANANAIAPPTRPTLAFRPYNGNILGRNAGERRCCCA